MALRLVDNLDPQTRELDFINCEIGILADLLECRANRIPNTEEGDPLYFVVDQLRRIRDRLIKTEEGITVFFLDGGRETA